MANEMKCTPGPWALNGSDVIYDPRDPHNEYAIAAIYDNQEDGSDHFYWVDNTEEREANALLIAAAPDHALIARLMIEHRISWRPFFPSGQVNGRGELIFDRLCYTTELDEFGIPKLTEHLRTVIARAEGEQK